MVRIPEPPKDIAETDLMRRLKAYSDGKATWNSDGQELGPKERKACQLLFANLTDLIEKCLHPLMDRISSHEMQTFTMHDRAHGIKVTHLMWHIISPSRREILTPGEIALLVASAHLHDLGMGLSDTERKARLQPSSDLWDGVDSDINFSKIIARLNETAEGNAPDEVRAEALFQVQQAQEAILCTDTRMRHATRERYLEIFELLIDIHNRDPKNIPNVQSALIFDGDSFSEKLIEICISHNEDTHALLDRDPLNMDQWRFPNNYPIGCCIADTKFVAVALRLADVLDFDRDRTPPILFHYLLPKSGNVSDNISIREWSKHLAISNWEIDTRKIVFRGRSKNAIIHHTIVHFCKYIEDEISRSVSIFGDDSWPFNLYPDVEPAIDADGYRYVPYAFSLDEERIYQLLMGRSIYREPLDALRELIQNALDACRLRDALIRANESSITPTMSSRIIVQYEDARSETDAAVLRIIDSGIGMDRYIIENYFLKVGRSYYRSSDFQKIRSSLRKRNLDFSPVSEFGIGFMATFMLGDKIEVDTASTYPIGTDHQRRTLRIDGLGRLIEVTEEPNIRVPRLQGTSISVWLRTKSTNSTVPAFEDVENYLRQVCINLPYPIHLQHSTFSGISETIIAPQGLKVPIPEHLRRTAIQIEVNDKEANVTGEIVLYREAQAKIAEAAFAKENPYVDPDKLVSTNRLIRGGFSVGAATSLPSYIFAPAASARIELTWQDSASRRLPTTNIGRTRLVDQSKVDQAILKAWITYLLKHISTIERSPIGAPDIKSQSLNSAKWLEEFDAFTIYRLARSCWIFQQEARRKSYKFKEALSKWEKSLGAALPLGWPHNSLHRQLFDLIFPHIAELVVAEQGRFYIAPPIQGWRTKLKKLKTFVREDKRWGPFAVYSGSISSILYDRYPGNDWLNIKYANNFRDWSKEDLAVLRETFEKCGLAKEHGFPAQLSRSEVLVLERASFTAGNLFVSHLGKTYRVNEFL